MHPNTTMSFEQYMASILAACDDISIRVDLRMSAPKDAAETVRPCFRTRQEGLMAVMLVGAAKETE